MTDGVRFSPPQDFSHAVRQDNGAHTLIGLCLADGVLALPLAVEGAAHLQHPGISVEVTPLQTADLTAAQAGHQFCLEEVSPHFVLFHHCEEGVQLRTGEDTLGLVVGLGSRCPLGGVPGNDMRLHRVLQRSVEGGVDMTNHRVRELMIHFGVLVDAPLRFQATVHSLDVLLRDKGDLLVAQLRLNVAFDVAAVACISCARLLAAQTYTTVRRKQLLKLFRKIVAETMRLSRYLGMWGTRGAGSQVS